MFGKQPQGPPPGEDQAGAPLPSIPPARTFVVVRDNKVDETVRAHEVEFNQAGNVLRFRLYYIHSVIGPAERIVRCFNGWTDYYELEESGIVTA